jgi:hypothetical protein
MRVFFRSFLFAILLTACGNSAPVLEGLDLEAWKADKNGCSGFRNSSVPLLKQQRLKLRGFSEMEIVDLLGHPDRNELHRRNQKLYFYFLQPGPACKAGAEKPIFLSIGFNATGLAKEILLDSLK